MRHGWITAIGMMSGTSLDGVDAALIETDGIEVRRTGQSVFVPYAPELRERMRACFGNRSATNTEHVVADDLTQVHVDAVNMLMDKSGMSAADIGVIGFHGQTVFHEPASGLTRQIGTPHMLAEKTGIPVVADFRLADVAAGGEGAPLAPVYHAALIKSAGVELPVAVLNIGGVSNVTYIDGDDALLAFDCGPGNARIDDWILRHTGNPVDLNGATAASGTGDPMVEVKFIEDPYFDRNPPKSLDREDMAARIDGLVVEAKLNVSDGAATLANCTVAAIVAGVNHLPAAPKGWFVCGGGRHNNYIMETLATRLGVPVQSVDVLDWDGDAVEAECFGFLAVRHLRDLPLSFPGTTGVPEPCCGGKLYPTKKAA
ncbi:MULTISPECIES: anhydro-N-acetylmuramic acid kinase [unclassified Thalassospira]|uniref:anhydro-N-acetylmuramic acid kinase n=1 Tax=unclassified Thalassospira TaxID=2648997 RepID=UPI0007A6431A|nr:MULTISPECIES: anhydro-N-acetylmuramic acid kinase [unclassified Thalassospira]KZC99748.1 anhydro-N-acetylmuramic acid kinase [Thalassospira sp. MCCC 1A02898]ONH86083.1 anhydro-N-acetylmuramic acid kinase [Thalassospira sp. MCCC 1A02803]